jgi:hypothetical protein
MDFQQRLVPNQGTVTGISTTAVKILNDVPFGMKRTAFVITNTSTAAQIITVTDGILLSSLGGGIPLYGNSSDWQSNGDGFTCSQNAIYCVSSAASGQVAYMEQLETDKGV